jgi:hypothetical protein
MDFVTIFLFINIYNNFTKLLMCTVCTTYGPNFTSITVIGFEKSQKLSHIFVENYVLRKIGKKERSTLLRNIYSPQNPPSMYKSSLVFPCIDCICSFLI